MIRVIKHNVLTNSSFSCKEGWNTRISTMGMAKTTHEMNYSFSFLSQPNTTRQFIQNDSNKGTVKIWRTPKPRMLSPNMLSFCRHLNTVGKYCSESGHEHFLLYIDKLSIFYLFYNNMLKFDTWRAGTELSRFNSFSSLRRQGISSHDIDYVEFVGPGLAWGRILSTCVISTWSNDIKCKYMFMFPLQNLARKELNHNYHHCHHNKASVIAQSRLP